MKQRWVWLGLIVIFIAGTVCGTVGTLLYIRHKIIRVLEGGPDAMRQFVVERLSRRLNLSKEQKNAIAPIVGKAQQKLLAIRHSKQPEMTQVLEEARAEIEPLLNPAQRARLAELAMKVQSRWDGSPP